MKNYLFLLLLSLFCQSSFALDFELADPCSDQIKYKVNYHLEKGQSLSVSEITGLISKIEAKIEAKVQDDVVLSFLGTPTMGSEASTSISDTENRGRFFGWCFMLNGRTSGRLPAEVKVFNYDRITWYYCYAESVGDRGWILFHSPASILMRNTNDWGHEWYKQNICSPFLSQSTNSLIHDPAIIASQQ